MKLLSWYYFVPRHKKGWGLIADLGSFRVTCCHLEIVGVGDLKRTLVCVQTPMCSFWVGYSSRWWLMTEIIYRHLLFRFQYTGLQNWYSPVVGEPSWPCSHSSFPPCCRKLRRCSCWSLNLSCCLRLFPPQNWDSSLKSACTTHRPTHTTSSRTGGTHYSTEEKTLLLRLLLSLWM